LKLKYDEPLSNFAFNFNLRHYNLYHGTLATAHNDDEMRAFWVGGVGRQYQNPS
jgi:hypothetical protein